MLVRDSSYQTELIVVSNNVPPQTIWCDWYDLETKLTNTDTDKMAIAYLPCALCLC